MEQPQGMNQINQIGLMFIKQALEHDMSNPGEKKERGEARALRIFIYQGKNQKCSEVLAWNNLVSIW